MTTLNTIMYIEDDTDIQAIVKLSLETMGGYEVWTEDSGAQAIKALESKHPQLILLDVMMPEMDGPTFLTRIRALDYAKDIPVVFITAKVQKHEIESYYKLGAISVITKPFDPMGLAGIIKEIWRKHLEQ